MRSRRLRLAAAAAALTVVAGGGLAVAADMPTARSLPGLAAAPPAPAYDPAGVLSGTPVRGMILVKTCLPNRVSDEDLTRLRAIGINTIVLVLCGYVDNARDSTVASTSLTPTNAEIGALTDRLHLKGFAVQYVPMFQPGGEYFTRWKMKPRSTKTFFKSYQSFVLRWAKLAGRHDVELFSLGSEAGPHLEKYWKHWRTMAREVKKRTDGLVTYQTTALHVFDLKWWKYLDLISTSAHFSLASKPRPPVSELVYVWRNYWFPKLRALSAKWRKPVLFAEIGYASVLGTAARPAAGMRTGQRRSDGAQADAYRAFLEASADLGPWFRGAAWFYWYPVISDVGALDSSYSPRDKTAECVLAHAWSRSTLARLDAMRSARVLCAVAAQTL